MKKFLSVSLLVLALALLPSCGKEKDEPSGSSLVGTSWYTNLYGSKYFVIEFVSASDVEGYVSDSYGNPLYSKKRGTYTFVGGDVTFSNFVVNSTFDQHYTNARVAGNMMKVYYWWEMEGNRYEGSDIYHKDE